MANSKSSNKADEMKKELWATFLNEVDELLDGAEQLLLDLENKPDDEELIAGLFRNMHTFKGTSGMMGLSNVEALAHSAEDVMDLVRDKALELSSDVLDLMFDTLDELKAAREHINANLADIDLNQVSALIEKLQATHRRATGGDDDSESGDSASLEDNDALWQNLAEECEEQMDDIEKCLLSLEEDQDFEESINSLFRSLHTLKGHFGLAGLPVTTTFTHKCEDLVGLLKEGRIQRSSNIVDMLLNAIDILRTNFKSILKNRQDIDFSKIERSQTSLEKIIKEHLPDGDAEALESLIRDDDLMEVDNEYLSVYFDMVWSHLAKGKETLGEYSSENLKQTQQIFEEINEELAFATEQIAQAWLVQEIEKFRSFLNSATPDTTLDDLSTEFNALWHHFWDMESDATVEKINHDIKLNALKELSEQKAQTQNDAAEPANQVSPVIAETQETAKTEQQDNSSAMNTEEYLIKVWEYLGNVRTRLNNSNKDEIGSDQVLSDHIAKLVEHCNSVKEVDVQSDLDAIQTQFSQSQPELDEIAKYVNAIYTYFWEKEEDWSDAGLEQLTLAANTSNISPPTASSELEAAADSGNNSVGDSDFFNDGDATAETPFTTPTSEPSQDITTSYEESNVVSLTDFGFVAEEPESGSLTSDPIFTHDYLEKVEEDISLFRLKVNTGTDITEIHAHLSSMLHDAQRLDYQSIVRLYQAMEGELQSTKQDIAELKALFGKYELKLFEELSKIEELLPDNFPPGRSRKINISYMFRQWHAEHVYEALASLSGLTEDLVNQKSRWFSGTDDDKTFTQLFIHIREQLQTLLNACDFYHFQECARGVLFFIDYFNRASLDMSMLSEAMVAKSHEFATAIGGIIQAAREGYPVNESIISEIICSSEQEMHRDQESPLVSVATSFLQSINLPSGFEEILYEEVLEQVGEALQDNQGLYLIYSDIEEDENLAEGFMELLDGGQFNPITNATGYLEDRSIFHFLIASDLSDKELIELLETVDPTAEKIRLISLTISKNTTETSSHKALFNNLQEGHYSLANQEDYSTHYTDLQQSVGQLISVRSNISQIKSSLGEIDLFEVVEKLVNQNNGDWKAARNDVRHSLENYDADLKHLFQAQEDIGSVLDHLQDTVNSIREKPLKQLFGPIHEWALQVAEQLDKPIKIAITGEDIQAEQSHMTLLNEPIRQIIYLMIFFSIEPAADRKSNGKSIFADINIDANIRDDHIEIKLTDDGQGLGREIFAVDMEVEGQQIENLLFDKKSGKIGSSKYGEGFDFCQTKDELTQLGIDFGVRAELEQVREFIFTVPLTNNIVDGILVEAENVRYIIPVNNIKRIVNPQELEYLEVSANNNEPLIKLDGEVIPAEFLKSKEKGQKINGKIVIIAEYQDKTKAFAVDQLFGMQQVMVTPLQGHLSSIQGVSGCALLGRNDVGMVIDTAQLF